jgi:hypothetical protein
LLYPPIVFVLTIGFIEYIRACVVHACHERLLLKRLTISMPLSFWSPLQALCNLISFPHYYYYYATILLVCCISIIVSICIMYGVQCTVRARSLGLARPERSVYTDSPVSIGEGRACNSPQQSTDFSFIYLLKKQKKSAMTKLSPTNSCKI